MILHVLIAQRKEDYPEQYAPEALEVADEYAMDENPEWMADKVKEFEATNEFIAVKVIELEVDQASLRSLLIDAPRLSARLVESQEESNESAE